MGGSLYVVCPYWVCAQLTNTDDPFFELISCRAHLFVKATLELVLLLEHMITGVLNQVAQLQSPPVEIGSI